MHAGGFVKIVWSLTFNGNTYLLVSAFIGSYFFFI